MPTINVRLKDPRQWLTGKAFREAENRIRPILRQAHEDAGSAVQEQVMLNLTDKYLHVRSNTLRSRFNVEVVERGGGFVTIIGSPVAYAKIHDTGGVIHIPKIVPKHAKALKFKIGSTTFFRKSVKEHDVTMPRRPYFTDAHIQSEDEVNGIFSDAMEEIMRDLI